MRMESAAEQQNTPRRRLCMFDEFLDEIIDTFVIGDESDVAEDRPGLCGNAEVRTYPVRLR